MFPKYVADPADVPDMTDERDAVGGLQFTYCGWCRNGTEGTDEKKWKIVRYATVYGNGATVTSRMFPDGSLYFDRVWDDRDTYNYIYHR
jgi:hypothetical protein